MPPAVSFPLRSNLPVTPPGNDAGNFNSASLFVMLETQRLGGTRWALSPYRTVVPIRS